MIRRAVFACVVLIGTIFWANCDLVFPLDPPPTPRWNSFFEGCFQGPTDSSASGDVIIVIETQPDEKRLVGGCLRRTPPGQSPDNGSLTGEVLQDDEQHARVTIMPSSGQPYTLRIQRNPAGEMNAATLDLSNLSGAPFNSAPNLPKQQPCPTSCQGMGFRMPFLPGGGTP